MGVRGRGGPIHAGYASSSRTAMLQQMRGKIKNENKKKSKSFLELSWADDRSDFTSYTPISLPYVVREEADEEGHRANRTGPKSKRPSVKHVDEANRNAASLFDPPDEETEDLGRVWFLLQFPKALPALDSEAMQQAETEKYEGMKGKQEKQNSPKSPPSALPYQRSSLNSLPEGKMGKVVIHKSGKVRMRVGSHVFDVNQGSDCDFAQEAGCLLPDNNEFVFLGRCSRRMIVVPDVSELIEKAEKEMKGQRAGE
eukprot:GHVN01102560.1.p1 GENE.GHVN01102560.1~~GHVN01102560.1.p1  ORF type:complete len:255 (+),score=58.29 GHVN01102560.1:578-1342(+)